MMATKMLAKYLPQYNHGEGEVETEHPLQEINPVIKPVNITASCFEGIESDSSHAVIILPRLTYATQQAYSGRTARKQRVVGFSDLKYKRRKAAQPRGFFHVQLPRVYGGLDGEPQGSPVNLAPLVPGSLTHSGCHLFSDGLQLLQSTTLGASS